VRLEALAAHGEGEAQRADAAAELAARAFGFAADALDLQRGARADDQARVAAGDGAADEERVAARRWKLPRGDGSFLPAM
jgi:hypothetical protein